MKVWVLTKEVNDYCQYGEYFVAIFQNKPTESQLVSFGVESYLVQHVLSGRDRLNHEDIWYKLSEEECL